MSVCGPPLLGATTEKCGGAGAAGKRELGHSQLACIE